MKEFLTKLIPKPIRGKNGGAFLMGWTYTFLAFIIYWVIQDFRGHSDGGDLVLYLCSAGVMLFMWIVVPISQKWFK